MAQTITAGRRRRTLALALFPGIVPCTDGAWGAEPATQPLQLTRAARTNLLDLSIDDLSEIEITSVSRRAERLADAAASIYVITAQDIRRSGATSIAQALRLAPNLQVARIDASQYAISARGFNSSTANKLLVLMDGRSLYTPLFSGVFWDVQDTALEDIERIEVLSGPGATLWGANAVNGVINIVTRDARDTEGGFVSMTGGTRESGATARYARNLGDESGYRIYAKYLDRDATRRDDGSAGRDAWHIGQAGIRADGVIGNGHYTAQGDFYRGHIDQLAPGRKSINGYNLLGRWNRTLSDISNVQLTLYYDHTYRDYPGTFSERRDTWDFEAQHRFALNTRHETVWGAALRSSHDEVTNSAALAFLPTETTLQQVSLFAQHTYHWSPDHIALTLGVRADRNDYSGVDIQPSLRLAWKAAPGHLLWGSLARAARAPSRIDRELFAPGAPPFVLAGGPDFQSEIANVAETGYRGTFGRRASVSATIFYADYSKLRSLQPSSAAPFATLLVNRIEGHAYGLETWGDWLITDRARLAAGVLWQRKSLHVSSGAADPTGLRSAGNDPRYQVKLRLSMDLAPDWELDTSLRRVGSLPDPHVPAYTAWDLRIAWRPSKQLEVAFGGRDLLDRWHSEFGVPGTRNELERLLYAQAIWNF